MRVWIENPFDNLPEEGFRPQRYWLMADAFSRAGHDTVLWTADFNHTTKARRLVSHETPRSFALELVHEPPYSRNLSLGRVLSHRSYARGWERRAAEFAAEHGRPDVIVASTPPLSACAAARRMARRFGAKLVVDVMDAWPETFERVAPRWMLAPLRATARANYREADVVTVVADRYIDLVRSYGRTGETVRFYHGIDLGGAPVRKPSADGVRLRLAYAGNLGRTYDLLAAVRALAELPGATLDIAGLGDGADGIERLASELGVAPRVRMHGYLGGEDLAAMLSECDAGLVPMAEDSCVGVPYKFCDYAKAGLAIVSSLGGESAKLLAKYRAGATYRPSDHASLVRVLRALDAAGCGANARRMAEAELDAAAIYDSYVNLVV